MNDYSPLYDGNRFGGGVLTYIHDDILCKELIEHTFPKDIEGIFIEINIRKIKWSILAPHRPSSQSIDYFFKNVGTLDICSQKHNNFFSGVTLTQNIVNQAYRNVS